jgi:hypothetical protein
LTHSSHTAANDGQPTDEGASRVTSEVGGEGGSPGDIEVEIDRGATTGSEAGETSRPARHEVKETAHDETGEGRRSP